MDWNFEFLFCYLAALHEVEQNKCKHDQQLSYNNNIRLVRAHARTPASYPSEGNSDLDLDLKPLIQSAIGSFYLNSEDTASPPPL